MNPLLIFLSLFVGIPLVELYFLIQVGSEIGALSTILLTILTAAVGGYLVRVQGFSVAARVQQALARDEVPAVEMLEGALLLIAGVLLLLPGFLTDAVGFLCLFPAVRRRLIWFWLERARPLQTGSPGSAGPADDPRVIEGEYRRHDD